MNILYTYKKIPDNNTVILPDWHITGLKGSILKSWKKGSDVFVSVELTVIDIETFKKFAHPNAKLGFYLLWHSVPAGRAQGTQLQGCVEHITFDDANHYELKGIVPGDKLSGGLTFTLICCLENEIEEDLSIYATKKGSIIFSTTTDVIVLEGDQALFPTKVKPFKDGMAPGALYYLEKKYQELDSNFYSSYTLYFNSLNKLFIKINNDIQNTNGESADEDKGTQYLLKEIMFDVYKTIILDALSNDSFTELQRDFTEDKTSLRAVYSNLIIDILDQYYEQTETLATLKEKVNGVGATQERERNKLFTALQAYIFGGNLNA